MDVRRYIDDYLTKRDLVRSIRNDEYRSDSDESFAVKLEKETEKVKEKIDKLGEPYKDIIVMHYIKNLNFKVIAHKLCYSYSRITVIHNKAVKMLEEMIDTNEEDT